MTACRNPLACTSWALLALVCGCAGDVEQSDPDSSKAKGVVTYYLRGGSDMEVIHAPGAWAAGGGEGEAVTVLLNGVPRMVEWSRGFSWPADQYILLGENKIEVRCAPSTTLHVSVDKIVDEEEAVNLVRLRLDPSKKEKAAQAIFREAPPYQLESLMRCDGLAQLDPEVIRRQVLAELQSIYQLLKARRGEAAAQKVYAGYKEFVLTAGLQAPEDVDSILSSFATLRCERADSLLPVDWDSVNLVIGSRGVLAYTDVWAEQAVPVSFKTVHHGSQVIPIPALTLIRVRGKWIVWNAV